MQDAECKTPNNKRELSCKLISPSKVNLGLWVKEKRSDGYHEIETIFLQNDSLFDTVEIEFKPNNKTLITTAFTEEKLNKQISSDKNIATKAATLFLEHTKTTGICKILIDKKIPTEAGLGGGSSNAATVLKGLNILLKKSLTEMNLISIASELGSDVPFFIRGKTCLGKGRGEILEEIENNLDLRIKVVKPENISISTKWAYEQIDSREFIADHRNEISNLKDSLKKKNYDVFFKNIFNDFEMVVFSYYTELVKMRNMLIEEGYDSVHLCGSGSAIFGLKRNVNC